MARSLHAHPPKLRKLSAALQDKGLPDAARYIPDMIGRGMTIRALYQHLCNTVGADVTPATTSLLAYYKLLTQEGQPHDRSAQDLHCAS